MSTSDRFPTLDYEDLRSPTIDDEYSFQNIRSSEEEPGHESGFGTREQSDSSRQLFAILAENRRLQRENESLRHCLILTKEHCDLKTANYVTSALAWCDDRLRQNYNGKKKYFSKFAKYQIIIIYKIVLNCGFRSNH